LKNKKRALGGGWEKDAKKIHGSDEKSSVKTRKIQKINKKEKGDFRIGEKTSKKGRKQAEKGDGTIFVVMKDGQKNDVIPGKKRINAVLEDGTRKR